MMTLVERIKMNQPNFDNMSLDDLAHYMVAHRNTPEGIEARQAFIHQMAKRAESKGIDFYRLQSQETSPNLQVSPFESPTTDR
jgi:hypothetical protein